MTTAAWVLLGVALTAGGLIAAILALAISRDDDWPLGPGPKDGAR